MRHQRHKHGSPMPRSSTHPKTDTYSTSQPRARQRQREGFPPAPQSRQSQRRAALRQGPTRQAPAPCPACQVLLCTGLLRVSASASSVLQTPTCCCCVCRCDHNICFMSPNVVVQQSAQQLPCCHVMAGIFACLLRLRTLYVVQQAYVPATDVTTRRTAAIWCRLLSHRGCPDCAAAQPACRCEAQPAVQTRRLAIYTP